MKTYLSPIPRIRRLQLAVIAILAGLAIIAGALLALLLSADLAHAEEGADCVCPAGNVKYEAGRGYAYTDASGSIQLSADAMIAGWAPAAGYRVTSVCIKIGGPTGGTLIFPPADQPPFESLKYAVSHVVLQTAPAGPTAVTLTEVRAESLARDYRPVILTLILVAGVMFAGSVARHNRQRR